MPLRQFISCNAGAIHRGLKSDIAPCPKNAKPRHQITERIGRGLRNALVDAGSHGPIQEVERQKLEHGNNKRSDGFPKIMLVQADTSIQHLYDSRQRAQDL
jgi:hypothetical protein